MLVVRATGVDTTIVVSLRGGGDSRERGCGAAAPLRLRRRRARDGGAGRARDAHGVWAARGGGPGRLLGARSRAASGALRGPAPRRSGHARVGAGSCGRLGSDRDPASPVRTASPWRDRGAQAVRLLDAARAAADADVRAPVPTVGDRALADRRDSIAS